MQSWEDTCLAGGSGESCGSGEACKKGGRQLHCDSNHVSYRDQCNLLAMQRTGRCGMRCMQEGRDIPVAPIKPVAPVNPVAPVGLQHQGAYELH